MLAWIVNLQVIVYAYIVIERVYKYKGFDKTIKVNYPSVNLLRFIYSRIFHTLVHTSFFTQGVLISVYFVKSSHNYVR